MDNLFHSYSRQNYRNKELIVILNNNELKESEYIRAAKRYKNVRIISLPERVSLGSCLNYGVQLSKYNHIAKFDDDDYYAPGYLTDSMRIMSKTSADIVGKRAHFMYLNGRKQLLYRYSKKVNQYVPLVQGATLLVKKRVFNKVQFPSRNRSECVIFCSKSLAKGYKIYAGNPFHFAAIRRSHSKDHTWIVSDQKLLQNARVLKVDNFRRFVSKDKDSS
ncbi:glycosyltransferase family 2 protein [Paenibacillus sp. KQZ6P-2]|uniref:Glycosyltransferase family 2 protein n=2 Tax=Paenibacillus mangrovi TaxID=2931978 RepID=A0A9X1WPJ3_9BACL|nr:glycosyltransferase family 2 protein [Paenibacillus mangrovi]